MSTVKTKPRPTKASTKTSPQTRGRTPAKRGSSRKAGRGNAKAGAQLPPESVFVVHSLDDLDDEPEAADLMQTARRLVWRTRYILAPLYVMALVAFLGLLVDAGGAGWFKVGFWSMVVAVATWVTTVGRNGSLGRSMNALLAGFASSIWLTVVAGAGISRAALVILLIGTIALAVPWWWSHRIRSTPEPEVDIDDQVARWMERVSAPGTILPESQLVDVEPIEYGWRATIVLPPGKLETADAVGRVGKITSAYELPLGSLIIEPTKSAHAHTAQLTVLPANPLYQLRVFTMPSLDPVTGLAVIGMYGDGEPSKFRFWMPGSGTVAALVSGTKGSGKSRLLDLILSEARHSGLITTWLIDPQRGQSMPDWIEHVDWAATNCRDALTMLKALKAVMLARSEYLATVEWTDEKGRQRKGKAYFEPTPEMPILMVVIDELAELLADEPEAIKILESISKLDRKTGIMLVLATQMPSVTELGGSSVLRSMVASGNVVVFRTADRLSGGMAFQGSLPVDPSTIPRELEDGTSSGGIGFLAGAESRAAAMRTWYVEDPIEWATSGTPASLDQLSVTAAGQAYAYRHQPSLLTPQPAAPTTGPQLTKPTGPSTGPTPPAPVGNDPTPTGVNLTLSAQLVLAALSGIGGRGSRQAIYTHAVEIASANHKSAGNQDDQTPGISYKTCGNALNELAEAGQVTKTQIYGEWALTGDSDEPSQ